MFNNNKDELVVKKKAVKKSSGMVSVLPKKDFRIVCNGDDIKLIEGEKIEVPGKYIQNLKTEGVM